MIRVLYLIFALLVALAGLAFHVRNNHLISIDYFAGTLQLEMSWLLVGVLIVGVLLGALGMTGKVLGLGHEVRRLNRANSQAERELTSLRAVALKDGR